MPCAAMNSANEKKKAIKDPNAAATRADALNPAWNGIAAANRAAGLERAVELQALLGEAIVRLRPRDQGEFGTSEAWRYYNALYFPYVAGVRPYRRRDDGRSYDAVAQQALAWFDAQVPQRTLHNWQNSAAKLIASELYTSLG